jgi:serine/threonine protein kinase
VLGVPLFGRLTVRRAFCGVDSTLAASGIGMRDSPVKLGSMVSKYRILNLIGCGGCAWVFQATDNFLERDVAIKILHCKGGVTPEMLLLGRAEAKLLVKLHHANIVETFDAGMTENGLLFIVMELLVGRSLSAAMNETERMTENDALPIFLQVADAMKYAHSLGAIHRDLKPENIFVTQSGKAKVLDFGIAKIMDNGAPTSTKKDGWFGTLLYMSPEQVQCGEVSFGSDIYSLGILFWEVLGGVHPLLTDCGEPSMDEIAIMHTKKIPPSIHGFRTDVSQRLSQIIDRAMSKKAQERYTQMSDFADALRECHAHRRMHRELPSDCNLPLTPQALRASIPTVSAPSGQFESKRTRLGVGALDTAANRTPICLGEQRLAKRLHWHQALILGGLMGIVAFGLASLSLALLKPIQLPTTASLLPATIPPERTVASASYGQFAPFFLTAPPTARDRNTDPTIAVGAHPEWRVPAP